MTNKKTITLDGVDYELVPVGKPEITPMEHFGVESNLFVVHAKGHRLINGELIRYHPKRNTNNERWCFQGVIRATTYDWLPASHVIPVERLIAQEESKKWDMQP